MSRTIGCLGYVGRPEFAYEFPVDEDQIRSMLAARDDRILVAHWDDLDAATLVTRAWDVRGHRWLTEDFSRCAALLVLEAPMPGSEHADHGHAVAAMREIRRRGIPAVNPMRTFLDHSDKRYLVERRELPFPPTTVVTPASDLGSLLAGLPEEVVLKPLVGCGGEGVVRLPRDAEAVRAAMQPGQDYLLQPFLPEILAGERCLHFFAKRFRYALVKKPKPGEFRTNEGLAIYERYEPTAGELRLAEEAIRRFASPSLIERVDLCGPFILEMTIGCPGLKIKRCGVEREIGPWTYEAIEMAIDQAPRGIT